MQTTQRKNESASQTRLICPLMGETPIAMRAGMILARDARADTIECRLDFLPEDISETDLADILHDAPLPIIATCRPVRQGGQFTGSEPRRLAILEAAGKSHSVAWVDIEDDVPQNQWPLCPQQIILSHHNFDHRPENLDDILAKLDASDAAVNKIAFAAAGPQDAFAALEVLGDIRIKKPTIALAMGEAGLASRVLAKVFGAFGTFASLAAGGESAPGQPSLDEMHTLYRWDSLTSSTKFFGVVACPVGHSMSPAIHNAAFAETGFDGVYLPLRVEDGEENFQLFFDALLARPWLNLGGLSVTLPHKQHALRAVGMDNCDQAARKIGAINTIAVSPDGELRGSNTDLPGAIEALCNAMGISPADLAGRAAVVLGAGGVSRAIVAGLRDRGAAVTICNRTLSKAELLAKEFGCRAAPLDQAAARNSDAPVEILINCTSLGMHPHVEATPATLQKFPPSLAVVFDTIYNPLETRLLREARQRNALAVSGLDMFVRQAALQFETWTKTKNAPVEIMRKIVLEKLQQSR